MDFYSIAIAVLAGLGIGLLLLRTKNTDMSKIHFIDLDDFLKNMRKGQLIDLRKNEAFETEKIKGARSFKPSQLTGKYSRLRRDLSVYLYCENGRKSKRIAKKLSRDNFSDIYILKGGFQSYKNEKK